MADTILGMHPNDNSPDWAQFDFNFDQEQLTMNSTFQTPESFFQQHQNQQQNYDAYNPDAQPTLFNHVERGLSTQNFTKGYQEFDYSENGNNTRLTQEQMAALETSFQEQPKPKTEYKKGLAERLGLDFQRVNHWYQNRRQKAKSQRHSSRSGSDGFNTKTPKNSVTLPLSLPETSISNDAVSGQHLAQDHEAASGNTNEDSMTSYLHMLHQQVNQNAQSSNRAFDHPGQGSQPHLSRQYSAGAAEWTSDLDSISFAEALDNSMGNAGHSLSTSQRLQNSQSYLTGMQGRGSDFVNRSPLNYKRMGSGLPNNGSTQTINSTASSLGELFTPPNPPTPLPWVQSEYDSRRASDSSELAHNVEGMHLQQGPPHLALMTNNLGPSAPSSMISTNGITTPDTSPEQLAGQPYCPPSDLASRRKRVRPPALRSEGSRSTSGNDPLNHSPHSRTSSVGAAPSGPARRSQSSGQQLNSNFRIRKGSNYAAQISPRNLQTHLDKHAFPPSQGRSNTNSVNGSPTTPQHVPTQPSASAASASRSPAEYQHEFHVRSASSSQGTSGFLHMARHANSSVPNLHSTSQVHGSLSVHPSEQHNPQLGLYHGPPQSAPPHQSSFFEESPNNIAGPFPPPGSHVHGFPHAQPNELHFTSAPSQQHSHYQTQADPLYLPPFAPQYTFSDSSHMTGYPSNSLLPGYPLKSLSSAPAPAVELDIKVELGPQPKLSQRFEKCEFQHTFANKWGQNGDKK